MITNIDTNQIAMMLNSLSNENSNPLIVTDILDKWFDFIFIEKWDKSSLVKVSNKLMELSIYLKNKAESKCY